MLGLPSVVPGLVLGLLEVGLAKLVRDFIANDIPKLAAKKQADLQAELKAVKAPGTFLGLPVTHDTPTTVTLLLEVDDADVSYPTFNSFPPKMEKIPGMKIGLARAEIEINREPINFTDSSKPIVSNPKIQSYALELSIKRPDYFIDLGTSKDSFRGYGQYVAELDLMTLGLRARGFWAQSDTGGFLISVTSDLPFPIPIASTGLGITRAGVIYGERFAPWLSGNAPPKDPIGEMRKASALNFVNWAASGKSKLMKWVPVDDPLHTYGIYADIGDLSTVGRIVTTEEAGLVYLDYGPTIVWGGRVKILDSLNIGYAYGALDLRSKSLSASTYCELNFIEKGLSISGGVSYSASLTDQTKTWIAIGDYAMNGGRVKVLDGLFEMYGGFRLVPLQGAAARAGARLHSEGKLLGLGGGVDFSIEVSGHLGWNPMELGGELDVAGSAWINAFGMKVGAGVSAQLALQLSHPAKLIFKVEFTVSLPWPLPDVHVPATIFDIESEKNDFPEPKAILGLVPAAPIPFIHRATGIAGVLDTQHPSIWPDVSFDIPFSALCQSPALVVNGQPNDGIAHIGDGDGLAVEHVMTRLEIWKVDEKAGSEVLVPNISAAWLGTNIAGQGGRSSRIAIPCNDPLGWLQEFTHSTGGMTAKPVEEEVLQTFGSGPNHDFPVIAGAAKLSIGALRLKSTNELRLVNLNWIAPYQRALYARDVEASIIADLPAGPASIPVTSFDIRLVSAKRPALRLSSGTADISLVRRLDNGLCEWRALVTRPAREAHDPLRFDGGEAPMCIVAIGYTQNMSVDCAAGDQTVLEPGVYKLRIEGTSTTGHGGASKRIDWPLIAQKFTVEAPPLRPYIRYATLGDERLFGVKHPGWNPNPQGIGFGHYPSHKGVIRSRVGYLSKIYKELWIACDKDLKYQRIQVEPCTDGILAGSQLSQEWKQIVSGNQELEEELLFEVNVGAGQHLLQVGRQYVDSTGVAKIEIIDQWPYRVSGYDSPFEHLSPKTPGVTRLFGPFGAQRAASTKPPTLPAGFNFDAVPAAVAGMGWILPAWIRNELDMSSPDAALTYMRMFEWAGLFQREITVPQASVLARHFDPELNLLIDPTGMPAGFVLMTGEPCDWRRVDIIVVHGDRATFDRRFATRLIPSPDGCSCLFLLVADGVPVRIPRGNLALRIRFNYRMGPLATLVEVNPKDPAATLAEVIVPVTQALGRDWNV